MSFENTHERQRLLRLYESFTDEELLRIAKDWPSLTPQARDAVEDEMDRRGLDEPEPEAPSSEIVTEHRPLVTVAKFGDLHEALLAKGMLDTAGIECYLVDDNMVRLDWLISNILGGVKLAVTRSNVRAAEELLAEPMPRGFRVEGVGLYEQPACHACGSHDVRLAEFGSKWRCRGCGEEWEEG